MARKQKRRSFGSAAAVHKSSASVHLRTYRRFRKSFARMIKEGRCSDALLDLLEMSAVRATAKAHLRSTKRNPYKVTGRGASFTADGKLRRAFRAACGRW